MKEIVIPLEQPISVGGVEQTEIVMREPTIGDEEDAMQDTLCMKRASNPHTLEICLIARITRVPYDVLRSINRRDYRALYKGLVQLNNFAPEPDEAGGENPFLMMTESTIPKKE